MNLTTIRQVSFERVYYILSAFSKITTKIEPEKQKVLVHSLINKLTVNAGSHPAKRRVKDIEMFFDASLSDEFVLIYDTAHRIVSKHKVKFVHKIYITVKVKATPI